MLFSGHEQSKRNAFRPRALFTATALLLATAVFSPLARAEESGAHIQPTPTSYSEGKIKAVSRMNTSFYDSEPISTNSGRVNRLSVFSEPSDEIIVVPRPREEFPEVRRSAWSRTRNGLISFVNWGTKIGLSGEYDVEDGRIMIGIGQ